MGKNKKTKDSPPLFNDPDPAIRRIRTIAHECLKKSIKQPHEKEIPTISVDHVIFSILPDTDEELLRNEPVNEYSTIEPGSLSKAAAAHQHKKNDFDEPAEYAPDKEQKEMEQTDYELLKERLWEAYKAMIRLADPAIAIGTEEMDTTRGVLRDAPPLIYALMSKTSTEEIEYRTAQLPSNFSERLYDSAKVNNLGLSLMMRAVMSINKTFLMGYAHGSDEPMR